MNAPPSWLSTARRLFSGGAGGGRPVVIRPGTGREPYLARLPGLDREDSVVSGRPGYEAVNRQALGERVPDANDDVGAF